MLDDQQKRVTAAFRKAEEGLMDAVFELQDLEELVFEMRARQIASEVSALHDAAVETWYKYDDA